MTDKETSQQPEQLINPKGSGTRLKEERERQKRTLEEVADAMNLSHSQLRIIESDQVEGLPEPTYVRGYIRTYANVLGLNPDDVLKHYKNPNWTETNSLNDIPKRIGSAEESRGKFFTKRRVFGSLTALAVIAGLWFSGILPNYFGFENTAGVSNPAPIVTSNTAETPDSVQVVENEAAEAEVAANDSSDDDTTEKPVETTQDEPAATISDDNEIAVVANELVLNFNKTTWVDIRDADKNRLAYKSYAKDEELRVTSDTPLSVFIGNAEGVTVQYNGEPFDISEFVEGLYAKFSVGL